MGFDHRRIWNGNSATLLCRRCAENWNGRELYLECCRTACCRNDGWLCIAGAGFFFTVGGRGRYFICDGTSKCEVFEKEIGEGLNCKELKFTAKIAKTGVKKIRKVTTEYIEKKRTEATKKKNIVKATFLFFFVIYLASFSVDLLQFLPLRNTLHLCG